MVVIKIFRKLSKININLEIQIGEEIDVLSKINPKDELTIYWNKVYEPDVIKLGKKIRDNIFLKKNIKFKYLKGNILNEFQNVTKKDDTLFKVFINFCRVAEQIYISAVPSKLSKVLKKEKNYEYFKNNKLHKEILPKKNWYKKFEKYWDVSEKKSQNLLNDLIKNKI